MLRILCIIILGLWLSGCNLVLQRPGQPSLGPIEAYAIQHGRLAPQAVQVLAPFFVGHEEVWAHLRIEVLTPAAAEATRLAGMPGVTVLGDTWLVIPGLLDADGMVRGRVFSWSQPRGVALFVHEAFHVQQYLASPLDFVWEAVQGICLSLLHGELYDHDYVSYEREAIAFERQVRVALEAR